MCAEEIVVRRKTTGKEVSGFESDTDDVCICAQLELNSCVYDRLFRAATKSRQIETRAPLSLSLSLVSTRVGDDDEDAFDRHSLFLFVNSTQSICLVVVFVGRLQLRRWVNSIVDDLLYVLDH